ncbi:MAG: hypothetical protein PHH43_02270 [Candidatus Cloacimonetes bacterium]|nr:hypothetical protein [Candidatus Cloacimonadota bacterium]
MDYQRLIDFVTGKSVNKYYQLYAQTQWYSADEMHAYQLEKLKKLLNHCYCNVPYYTKLMKDNGIIPKEIKDFGVLNSFPVLTKEIIKANYDKFIPINESQIKGIRTGQTGGTTGNILNKRNDANTRSSGWGSYRRFYDWMDISPSDKVLTYWGGHVISHGFKEKMVKSISNKLKNIVAFDAYDTNPKVLDMIAEHLKSGQIKLIRSYPQALYTLALRLKEKSDSFSIKAIMTTSEPIMPQHRKLFKEVFGCDTFDQYGCGEIGGIAYECAEHKGLHVTDERVYLETNDNNDLLITDLDNYVMPYIRYWNADQAVFSEQECSCGRKSRVIEKVLGRTCDYLIGINGQTLHWAYFWHLLFDTGIAIKHNFVKFQIIQKAPDYLVFRTVSDPIPEDEKEMLRKMIRDKMGEMKVDFILETDIENSSSGKYRPVINELI